MFIGATFLVSVGGCLQELEWLKGSSWKWEPWSMLHDLQTASQVAEYVSGNSAGLPLPNSMADLILLG